MREVVSQAGEATIDPLTATIPIQKPRETGSWPRCWHGEESRSMFWSATRPIAVLASTSWLRIVN